MSVYLSIVIPAYNEAGRLTESLGSVLDFLKKYPHPCEVIVVDDGSADATAEVAARKLASVDHKVLKNSCNSGKGFSVKRGMLEARGEYVLFSDADLSTPIEEAEGFVSQLQRGYDVVIGSRALAQSNVEVHQNFLREIMGKVFNRIARAMSFKGINDSQCGFKAFTRRAAQDLFARQKLHGFSFDAEIMYLAQKLGYKILEEPVTWRNSPNSRVKIFSDPIKMFMDIAKIRGLHRDLR